MNIVKIIFFIMIFCCLTVISYSAYEIVIHLEEYNSGKESYAEIEKYSKLNFKSTYEDDKNNDDIKDKMEVDFNELNKINDDIVGWIYGKDTEINYPIVQGSDNNYYLNHLFNGDINSSGCIFLDYRNAKDFTDKNTIIYGHNMNNGTMFASLLNYKDEEYFLQHKDFYILTPEKSYKIEIFSCYSAETNSNSWSISFDSENDYKLWLDSIIDKSLWESSIEPDTSDRIVTFSTCTNNATDTRFVLHGIINEI